MKKTFTVASNPARTIFELSAFGYRFELFFAWFDFWIGIFYKRRTKTAYISFLPMIILSVKAIKPVVITEIKMERRIMFNPDFQQEQLEKVLKDNPNFIKDMGKRIIKHIENEAVRGSSKQ